MFSEFVTGGWSQKAIKDCLLEQSPEKIIERSKTRDQLIAVDHNKIIGVIEGREKYSVGRLFVDKKYHKKGVATKLMKKMEEIFKKSGTKKFIIHSSLYAQKFYEKMGYKKSTRLIKTKGMVYQPMIKYL